MDKLGLYQDILLGLIDENFLTLLLQISIFRWAAEVFLGRAYRTLEFVVVSCVCALATRLFISIF